MTDLEVLERARQLGITSLSPDQFEQWEELIEYLKARIEADPRATDIKERCARHLEECARLNWPDNPEVQDILHSHAQGIRELSP